MALARKLGGHLWTVLPLVDPRRVAAPAAEEWSLTLPDPLRGRVTLTGWLRREPAARGLVVLLHGIGGSADARYFPPFTAAASAAGLSCLRLNLRGCDRRGCDYYHGGQTDDLAAVLAALERDGEPGAERVFLVGFSLGGHMALATAAPPHTGAEPAAGVLAGAPPPNLAGAVAICAPLDLAAGARWIDRSAAWPYRWFVLSGLKSIYRQVAARHPVPLPVRQAMAIEHIVEWDDRIVAPRWGFASADDYYRRASVCRRLDRLQTPALAVVATADPLIPRAASGPCIERASSHLTARIVDRGGHLGFPRRLELGVAGTPPGLARQVIGWVGERCG